MSKIFSAIYQMNSNIDNSEIIGFNYNDTFMTLPENKFISRSIYYGLQLMVKNEDVWGTIVFKPSLLTIRNYNKKVECLGTTIDWNVFLNFPEYLNKCFKAENINNVFALHRVTVLGSSECQGLTGPNLYPVSFSFHHRFAWNAWKEQMPKILNDEIFEIVEESYPNGAKVLIPKTTNTIFDTKRTSIFEKAEQQWIDGWNDYYTTELIKDKNYDDSLIKLVRSKLLNIL